MNARELFDLKGKVDPYTRCIDCNSKLKSLSKSRAKNLVAPFVHEKAESFAMCPDCGQVFWKGTHFEDMDATIEKILDEGK